MPVIGTKKFLMRYLCHGLTRRWLRSPTNPTNRLRKWAGFVVDIHSCAFSPVPKKFSQFRGNHQIIPNRSKGLKAAKLNPHYPLDAESAAIRGFSLFNFDILRPVHPSGSRFPNAQGFTPPMGGARSVRQRNPSASIRQPLLALADT
jgi:hypothetical protein